MRAFRFCAVAFFAALPSAFAQRTPIAYPPTATVDSVDHYGGVSIPSPYPWLGDLNSPDTTK